jgi:hypothetical protein
VHIDVASAVDDCVNAVARNANRMGKLVLAHADLGEELFLGINLNCIS